MFDNAIDDDPRQSGITSFLQSNSLQIQNRKLTDFTECRTNRVLIHDDISNKFSSRGFQDIFVELEEVDFIDNHVRYLIQIVDPDTGDIQVSELVLQSSTLNTYPLLSILLSVIVCLVLSVLILTILEERS